MNYDPLSRGVPIRPQYLLCRLELWLLSPGNTKRSLQCHGEISNERYSTSSAARRACAQDKCGSAPPRLPGPWLHEGPSCVQGEVPFVILAHFPGMTLTQLAFSHTHTAWQQIASQLGSAVAALHSLPLPTSVVGKVSCFKHKTRHFLLSKICVWTVLTVSLAGADMVA